MPDIHEEIRERHASGQSDHLIAVATGVSLGEIRRVLYKRYTTSVVGSKVGRIATEAVRTLRGPHYTGPR